MKLIRKAKESDLDNIHDLYLSLLESHPEAFVDSYDSESKKDIIEWKKDLIKNHLVIYVAEENEKLIGMSALEYHDKDIKIPYITKMGVLPQYEGRGIGRELMEISIKGAQKLNTEEIRLFVMADMNKTISFYTKFGFTLLKKLPNDIEDHSGKMRDVNIMRKTL